MPPYPSPQADLRPTRARSNRQPKSQSNRGGGLSDRLFVLAGTGRKRSVFSYIESVSLVYKGRPCRKCTEIGLMQPKAFVRTMAGARRTACARKACADSLGMVTQRSQFAGNLGGFMPEPLPRGAD